MWSNSVAVQLYRAGWASLTSCMMDTQFKEHRCGACKPGVRLVGCGRCWCSCEFHCEVLGDDLHVDLHQQKPDTCTQPERHSTGCCQLGCKINTFIACWQI